MGKKLAKEIMSGCFIYNYGSYYGNYNGYDIIIRYDYTSLLYNVYLNVSGKENIDSLNKILSKIDEFAVAKYNSNILIISEACDKRKDMPKLANKVIEEVTSYLKKNKYKNLCRKCNKNKKTILVETDGNTTYLCEDCIKDEEKKIIEDQNKRKNTKEDLLIGILNAIVGCLPGFILWLILAYLKINPTVVALLIMLGSAYFYKWGAKSMKLPGLIISIIIGFIFVIFANEITNAYNLYTDYLNQYYINIIDAYKALPYYLSKSTILKSSYNQSLILSLLFAVFGSLTNLAIYRSYNSNNKVKRLEVK